MKMATRILTREFVLLCGVMFVTFCNLAVFFQFDTYLGTLHIEKEWSGFLIGVFSLTVLAIRPIISPFLNERNARFWILVSTVGIIMSLFLYDMGTTPSRMAGIRIAHGLAYVVLATAALSGIVSHIPPSKSAQAFGILSVLTLLPYAVIPPLVQPLEGLVGDFSRVLDLLACAMFLVFPIMLFVRQDTQGSVAHHDNRIAWHEVVGNLRDRNVILLMIASLLVWTAFSAIFYYLKGYAGRIDVANAGWFFTLSTFSEIGVRLAAGPIFDRYDKSRFLAVACLWLAASYAIMLWIPHEMAFYAMGIVFGLGWGVTMPMLSGIVFDISPPKLRPFNTNLAMEMFQGGYFLGPLAGGALVLHWGYETIFYAGAAVMALAFFCAVSLAPSVTVRCDQTAANIGCGSLAALQASCRDARRKSIGSLRSVLSLSKSGRGPGDEQMTQENARPEDKRPTYEVDLFKPEDAPGVVDLFKAVYGDGYPIRIFYDTQALIEANETGEYYCVVARTDTGKIVGVHNVFRSAPNTVVYEWGVGLTLKEMRGFGVFNEIGRYVTEEAIPRLGISAAFGEAVCNHLHSQKMDARSGFLDTALEVALMPGHIYSKEPGAARRVAALLQFRTYKKKQHRVFLPAVYEKELRFLYSELDDQRDFHPSEGSPRPGTSSHASLEVFDFAQVARMAFQELGSDFDTRSLELEDRARAQGAVVFQIWLPLNRPWVGSAVETLRSRGYFLGGPLIQWFGEDGLLMQKLECDPDFDKIQLYSEKAKQILDFVRNDWARTTKE